MYLRVVGNSPFFIQTKTRDILGTSTVFFQFCSALHCSFPNMVSASNQTPVSGIKLSSVVPAEVTGDDKDQELTNMDLALKLHYVRGLYLFKGSEAIRGLTIFDLKEPMSPWLVHNFPSSGRIRLSENTGRPFLKCNDGGVRIVEAYCETTMEEWLAMSDHQSLDNDLVYDQVLGPDLGFSPLVYIQFTWFNCGGVSVGLSWAHVLGDPFTAANFINMWGQIMQGRMPSKSLHPPLPKESKYRPSIPRRPLSLKQVDPVGNSWLTANNCKMETHSFHVAATQLDSFMLSQVSCLNQRTKISHFHVLSAIIWKSISKVREDSGPRIVTICTRKPRDSEYQLPCNNMVFSIVQADFSLAEADEYELAGLIAEKQEEENSLIEAMVETDNGESDYILYGANLTFVNMEEANIYGLEVMGQTPILANYTIKGVGDEGVVMVLPGPDSDSEKQDAGRTATVVLPENQLIELKKELRKDWGLS